MILSYFRRTLASLLLLLAVISLLTSATMIDSNIKNHIFITLEMENVQYGMWAKLLFRHYLLLFSLYKMDQFVFFKSTQSYMTYVLTRYHIKCNFELKWLFVFIVYLVPLPSDLSFDHGLTFFSFAFCPLSAARLMVAANYEKAEAEKILLIKWAEGEAESKYLSGLGIAR